MTIMIGIALGIQALAIGSAGLPALIIPAVAGIIGMIGGFIETKS